MGRVYKLRRNARTLRRQSVAAVRRLFVLREDLRVKCPLSGFAPLWPIYGVSGNLPEQSKIRGQREKRRPMLCTIFVNIGTVLGARDAMVAPAATCPLRVADHALGAGEPRRRTNDKARVFNLR